MGLTCAIVCVTCRAVGPPIGDFGYLGRPTMKVASPEIESSAGADADDEDDEAQATFGYFYKTFRDVGITTDELEVTATFLRAHEGHRVVQYADGFDDPELDRDEALGTALEDGGGQPLGYLGFPQRARDGFTIGQYTLTCACGAVHRSPVTILKPLPPVPWTPQLLDRFEEMIGHDSANAYRLTDALIDPTAEEEGAPLPLIGAFVGEHVEHGVTGSVVPALSTREKPPAWTMWMLAVVGTYLTGSGLYELLVLEERRGGIWVALGAFGLFRAFSIYRSRQA